MVELHVDTDIGGDIDDLCALALVLRWPGAELVGVTTVAEHAGRRAGYVRRVLELAGAPSDALLPLMQRVIDNNFELTGPVARGDWTTVDAHLAALHAHAPELEALYRALADELAASQSRRTTPALPVAAADNGIDR